MLSAVVLLVSVGHDVFEVVGISTVFILAHAVLRNSRQAALANTKQVRSQIMSGKHCVATSSHTLTCCAVHCLISH